MPRLNAPARTAALLIALAGMSLPVLAQGPSGDGNNGGGRPQRQERGNRDGNARPDRGPGGGGGGGGGLFGGGGGRFGMGTISTGEMARIGKMLTLDDAQKQAVEALHEAYVQDSQAQSEANRERFEQMRRDARENQDPSAFAGMGEEMRKVQAKRKELEDKFLADVKETLTPQQAEKWPSVERMRTRERSLGMGMLAGERLDVVRQVEDLKLDDAKAKELEPVLEQYAVELDRELKARTAVFDGAQGQFGQIMRDADTAKATKLLEDARSAAIKVRDVNKRYARQVEPMLPETQREAFTKAVQRESYPTIYRPSRTARTMERIAAFEDLTKEQKDSLKTLTETHDRDLATLQGQMQREYDRRETEIKPADVIESLMGGGGGGGGGRGGFGGGGMLRGMGNLIDTPAMEDLRTRRRELDTATLDKARALLTEDQKTRLDDRGDREGAADGERPRRNRGGEGNGRGRQRPADQQS